MTVIAAGVETPTIMPAAYPSILARNLDYEMRLKGYSNQRLALQAGLKTDLVRDIKRGTQDPGVYKVYEIARVLDTTIERLIGKEPLTQGQTTAAVQKQGKLIDKPDDLAFFAVWDRLDPAERAFVLNAAIDRLRSGAG